MWSLALLLACTAAPAADTCMGRQLAPTMSHVGAPWLIREDRFEERPDLLLEALQLAPGDVACDIGAGNGYHSLPMARAVAPGGQVVAVDIQPQMLAKLDARAREAGISNIERVVNTQTSTGLAHGFQLVRQRDDLPWQHVMVYQRDDGPAAAVPLAPWTP